MPTYDVACISSRKASKKQMNRTVGRVARDLRRRGGVVRRIDHYGMRPLAYPIRQKGQKHEIGRYFRMFVQASPQALKETMQTLRVDENIIRFKPFKLKPTEFLREREQIPFEHKAKISEAHYDALKRTTNIDYYVARTLLIQGKVTADEIQNLGTHQVKLEPYFRSREEQLAEYVFNDGMAGTDVANQQGDLFGVNSHSAHLDFSEFSDLSEHAAQFSDIENAQAVPTGGVPEDFDYLEFSDNDPSSATKHQQQNH